MNHQYDQYITGIPSGQASELVTPGALVLEGGAFRNLYSQGVCDALMERDLNYECIVGLSAGAMTGFIYNAGAIGAAGKFNITNRRNPYYVGLKALKHNNGIIGFDQLFHNLQEYGYDEKRMFSSTRRFVAVATNCRTGQPAYLEKGKVSDIYRAVNASASMPVVSKMLELDGEQYLDGICSGSIPVEWAMKEGYEKIVVICTKERGFVKNTDENWLTRLYRFWYRNHPELLQGLMETDWKYNELRKKMEQWEREGRIFVIAPSEPVTISNMESDLSKLEHLYLLGYQDGKAVIPALLRYMNSEGQIS